MQTPKFWRVLSTGMLVLLLLGLLVPSPAATQGPLPPQKAAAAEPALCQFPAPSSGEVSVLNAVASVPYYSGRPSHKTMWAVGYTSRQTIGTPDVATLTLYFNGRTWQVVPSPNVAAENVLTGVAAYSANDVWAVGHSYDGAEYRTLILHFNGVAWTVWQEPTVDWIGGSWNPRLTGVQILTGGSDNLDGPQPDRREAVAVGYSDSWLGPTPLVLHYDGGTWKPMALPPSMMLGRLFAVTGESLDDLWAVGTLFNPERVEEAYLFHHTTDGTTDGWTPIVKGLGTLTGLAVAGDRVFTVGRVQTFTGAETLVMAYTLSTGDWVQLKSFNKTAGDNVLTAVTAAAGKVYAVGYTTDPADDVTRETLLLAYDGVTFAPVDTPNPNRVSELRGVVVHYGVLWTVGTTGHGAQRSTLVLNNNCLSDR
jgi:hypothetical protein